MTQGAPDPPQLPVVVELCGRPVLIDLSRVGGAVVILRMASGEAAGCNLELGHAASCAAPGAIVQGGRIRATPTGRVVL